MRVLICAGDPSGDLYASMLVRALRRERPGSLFEAVGGRLLKDSLCEGDSFIQDLASEGITGFVEPGRRIPMLWRLLKKLRARMRSGAVDAVVCVDFYGFNRHVAQAAKSEGVPVFYLISPQVWASRPGRVKHLKRCVERMLVIFPFEEEIYREAGVPVTWIGHPLLDRLPECDPEKPLKKPLRLGLLPGSRVSEVRRHMPMLLGAATKIQRDFPRIEVSVFAAPQRDDAFYRQWIDRWRGTEGAHAKLVRDQDYQERAKMDIVLTSSGTATLENALLGLPMVVVYRLSWPTYLLARSIIRVPYIAMANLLAGRALVPELIQHDATSDSIARAALDMLGDPKKLSSVRRELLDLRQTLGGPGAIERAARAILDDLESKTESAVGEEAVTR